MVVQVREMPAVGVRQTACSYVVVVAIGRGTASSLQANRHARKRTTLSHVHTAAMALALCCGSYVRHTFALRLRAACASAGEPAQAGVLMAAAASGAGSAPRQRKPWRRAPPRNVTRQHVALREAVERAVCC